MTCVRLLVTTTREDDPGYAEVFSEPLKIRGLKILPSGLGVHFFEPSRSEARDTGGHAAIFFVIGQGTAFGERAESVIILARQGHVVGIEREQAVDRSILPNPGESLQPGILRSHAGQFEMRRRGIHLVLGIEHARAERKKEKQPTKDVSLEYIVAD